VRWLLNMEIKLYINCNLSKN